MYPPFVVRFGALLLALGLAAPTLAQSSAGARVPAAQDAGPQAIAGSQGADQAALRRPVTLTLVDASLAEALEEIARQAGLTLGYSPDVLPREARASLHAVERPAGETLARALQGTDLEVRALEGGQVTLVQRPKPTAGNMKPQTGTITGRVTDAETGAGLSGASVQVEGTERGTLTGSDGRYRLENVPAGTHTLVASMIGYSEQSQQVTVSTDQTVTADFALRVSAVPLDQVVVTGTIVPTEVRAIPTPITVITAEEIERLNIQRFDQIFRGQVPGVIALDQGDQNFTSRVIARGADALVGWYGLKTFIDGVEVADPRFLATIDPESIERIEVLRGPQGSTIYGSGATGGVLQIFTKKGKSGTTQPQITAKTSIGHVESPYADGFTSQQAHSLSVTGGAERFGYNLGASYYYTGEYTPEYYSREPSLFGGITFNEGPVEVNLSTRFYGKTFGSPNHPVFREKGYSGWTVPFNQENRFRQTTIGVDVKYSGNAWGHTLRIGRDETVWDQRNTAPRLRTPADTLYLLVGNLIEKTSASYSLSLDQPLGSSITATLTAGADAWQYELRTFRTDRAPRTDPLPFSFLDRVALTAMRTTNVGAFGQAQIDIARSLFLTGGLRAERNNDYGEDFGTALSPRVGIAYAWDLGNVTVKARAAYGESTRPPLPMGRLGSVSTTVVTLPNANLKPERQAGIDGGLDVFWGRRLSFSATFYDQAAFDLIDLATLDPESVPITRQFVNVARVDNTGYELSGSLSLDYLRLTTQYSKMNSSIRELGPTYQGTLQPGDRPWDVPEYTAAVTAEWTPIRQLTFAGRSVRVGEHAGFSYDQFYGAIKDGRFSGDLRDYVITYPSFAKADLSVQYHATERVTPFFSVTNLTNSRAIELNDLTTMPGRITTVGVRARF